MNHSLLEVSDLSVSFRTRDERHQAVKNVSFSLNRGEILGIVGESGSGKSVSCYSILGLIPCPPAAIDSGSVLFQGENLFDFSEEKMREIRGGKISMIFQDPMTSLNPYMTIGAQISEAITYHQKSSVKDIKERIIEALDEVGIPNPESRLNSYPYEFSGGMRQRVMIAMALVTEPDIIIADEPTTALDVTIQAQILALLQDIQRKRDIGIIFISHDLAVVKDVADKVLVMRKGEVVERGNPLEIFSSPQHPYTQALIDAIPSTGKISEEKNPTPILSLKNISKTYELESGSFWTKEKKIVHALDDVSLSIYQGEILGLVGESGSGKSTLGRSILRLVRPESGEILYQDKNILSLDKNKLMPYRRSVQMIFQDPYASLNPRMTVFDTIAEPILLHGLVNKGELAAAVNKLMDDVGLDRKATRKYPHEFSGGQRQRIAIARAIASSPKVIIADEPVSALDVTIQAQVLDLLLSLAKDREMSMLFISHDLSVVRYLCDRIAVMKSGRIVETGRSQQLFSEAQHEYTRTLLSAIPSMS